MGLFWEQPWMAVVAIVIVCSATLMEACPYTSIFSFGDSLADTGNLFFSSDYPSDHHCFFPPYGETYFHRVTGRCSDGRLIIDFIAESLGIETVKPYLGITKIRGWSAEGGANFAFIGATALESSFFEKRGVSVHTNYSLTAQLNCSKNYLQLYAILPQELIGLGARTLMVPGNLPIGCSVIYLTYYETMDKNRYDQYGCLKWLNKFAQYYNQKLQNELDKLRRLHPHANIIYADYYNAALPLYHDPTKFGFVDLKNCCGKGGPYNFNASRKCGNPGVIACEDPSKHIWWDGIHLTEAAYSLIAKGLISGPYTIPQYSTLCSMDISSGYFNS